MWQIQKNKVISRKFEVNNQKKAGKLPSDAYSSHYGTTGAYLPCWVLGYLSTLCLPYLTSDMTNSTECHLCHRSFRSGNRGTAKYGRRKQSLRECALQRDTVCQADQRPEFFGRGTKTGEGRREERQGPVWEVISQIPKNRSGNSLWLWLVCG